MVSHAGSCFSPVEYVADKSGLVYFCGCKLSEGQPLCDGSHSQLS
jgi:CDGSH-type Zn-finger protein